MGIQLFIIFIAIGLASFFRSQISNRISDKDSARKKYITVMCVLMTLQSGLRNVAVGADTYAYGEIFYAAQHISWAEALESFKQVYIYGVGKDPGYVLFEKFFQQFSTNYQLYLFTIAALFFGALGRLLYRTTSTLKEVLLSVAAYQALFYGFFSVTGIRQTIAVSILLYSYKSIINRQFLKFLIYCLIAVTIHKSALLFIPVYFFAKGKNVYTILSVCLCLTPITLLFGRQIAIIMTSLSITESYSSFALSTYETSGAQMFMLFMVLFAIMLFISRHYLVLNTDTRISIISFSVGLLLTPLTWVDPSMMRVVTYFSIFLLFLLGKICDALDRENSTDNSLITTITIVVFVLVIVKHNSEYAFFWQNMGLPMNY